MLKYLKDPFRGTKERRVLSENEDNIQFEALALERALKAAKLTLNDIDLILVASFTSKHFIVGNGAYLTKLLNVNIPTINIETACSGALAAINLAHALIASGQMQRVAILSSCNYTQTVNNEDPISFAVGDGAAACIVQRADEPRILSSHFVGTNQTCDVLNYVARGNTSASVKDNLYLKADPIAGNKIAMFSANYLRDSCLGALNKLNLTLDGVRFFALPTPTAWYVEFAMEELDIPEDKVINLNPQFNNMGPVMMLNNLYHAAKKIKFKPDDLVLLHTVGSASSAGAMVIKWGNLAAAKEFDAGVK